MDKTMELVLVAMVLMVSAVIIIAMANSQIGGFGETIDEQRGDVSDNLSDQLDNIDSESYATPVEPVKYNSQQNSVIRTV